MPVGLTISTNRDGVALEEQIDQWRTYLRRRQAIHWVDVAELKDHLRDQVAALADAGLSPDEAFLVAVKRMGDLDTFARVRPRALGPALETARCRARRYRRREGRRAHRGPRRVRARGAPVCREAARPLRARHEHRGKRNCRRSTSATSVSSSSPSSPGTSSGSGASAAAPLRWLALAFAAAALSANVYPFQEGGATGCYRAAPAHRALARRRDCVCGQPCGQVDGRMDFIRSSGELFVDYVLIGLGGGLLIVSITAMFASSASMWGGPSAWFVPCGAACGARRRLAGGGQTDRDREHGSCPDAPVRAVVRCVLVIFLGTLAWTGGAVDNERDVLIGSTCCSS